MKRAGKLTRHTCAICGNLRLARQIWSLVTEDCDLDQLEVWKWDMAFAQNGRADSVCGQRHLREFDPPLDDYRLPRTIPSPRISE